MSAENDLRYNKEVERITLLDIPIDPLSQQEVLLRIEMFLRSAGQYMMTTPNPEMLVEARKNAQFRSVLQNADLNIPDGIGLLLAAKLQGARLPERVTGTDTLKEFCARSVERIFLLGADPGIAERAAEVLSNHSHIHIVGTYAGSPRKEDEEEIIMKINAVAPTILFVAYGAPAQELWIARNLSKLPSVKVSMGVGGALDFIAGKRKRAPRWMQRLGMEWLWRILHEPRRIGRIWRAVVVFPFLILTSRSPRYVSRG